MNTAKLTQPRPNMATPLHRDEAYEKVVNVRRFVKCAFAYDRDPNTNVVKKNANLRGQYKRWG